MTCRILANAMILAVEGCFHPNSIGFKEQCCKSDELSLPSVTKKKILLWTCGELFLGFSIWEVG